MTNHNPSFNQSTATHFKVRKERVKKGKNGCFNPDSEACSLAMEEYLRSGGKITIFEPNFAKGDTQCGFLGEAFKTKVAVHACMRATLVKVRG